MREGYGEPSNVMRVGALLRDVRTRSNRDLAEISEALHIRQAFLANIEAGRLDGLPAPVYAIGFVRAYAEHLGLDSDDIVRRFKAELAGGSAAPLNFPLPLTDGGTPRAGVLFLGAVIAIAAYVGWYLSSSHRDVAHLIPPVPDRLERVLTGEPQPAGLGDTQAPVRSPAPSAPSGAGASGQPSAGAPSAPPAAMPGSLASAPKAKLPSDAPGPAVSETPPLMGADATAAGAGQGPAGTLPGGTLPGGDLIVRQAAPAPTQPRVEALAAEPPAGASIDAGSRIVLRARADSWIELRDGVSAAVLAARLLKAGEVLHVPDRPGLKMVTGNAGGLIVIVDGQPAPSLGKEGAVRRGIPLDADVLRRGLDGPSPQ